MISFRRAVERCRVVFPMTEFSELFRRATVIICVVLVSLCQVSEIILKFIASSIFSQSLDRSI